MQLGKPKKQQEYMKDLAKENLFKRPEAMEDVKQEEE